MLTTRLIGTGIPKTVGVVSSTGEDAVAMETTSPQRPRVNNAVTIPGKKNPNQRLHHENASRNVNHSELRAVSSHKTQELVEIELDAFTTTPTMEHAKSSSTQGARVTKTTLNRLKSASVTVTELKIAAHFDLILDDVQKMRRATIMTSVLTTATSSRTPDAKAMETTSTTKPSASQHVFAVDRNQFRHDLVVNSLCAMKLKTMEIAVITLCLTSIIKKQVAARRSTTVAVAAMEIALLRLKSAHDSVRA